ncbi:hypothetical protein D3C87_2166490 [compost metagenome]
MFQFFGDIMHLVPAETQLFNEKNLPETMLADHLDRHFLSAVRQCYTLVFFVMDQSLLRQLTQHIGY